VQLEGKVIVITGASRGIGQALSLAYAREGAFVVAAARKNRGGSGSLEETVGLIEQEGGQALAVRCDVTVPEDVEALISTTLRHFERIDVLVNNAGVGIWKGILDLTVGDWDTTMSVNIKGVFLTCKYALPHMMERQKGNIINVSSAMAHKYTPNDLAYSASKAALDRFTLNLAQDVQEYNIAVNSFSPGLILTDMVSGDPIDRWGHLADPPEAVVPPALWLAQQDAASFTAQLVHRNDFGHTWGI